MATVGASRHPFVYLPYSLTCLSHVCHVNVYKQAGALSQDRDRGKSFKILPSEQMQVGPDPEVARIGECGSGMCAGVGGW